MKWWAADSAPSVPHRRTKRGGPAGLPGFVQAFRALRARSSGGVGDVLVRVVLVLRARLREVDDVAAHPHAGPARIAQILHRGIRLPQQRLERARLLDGLLHQHLLAFEYLEARTHLDEQRVGPRQPLLRLADLA